jgi:hypothetical protein
MAIIGGLMALTMTWRTVSQFGVTLQLNLREARLCAFGENCEAKPLVGSMATFGTVMTVLAVSMIVVCAVRIVALLRGRDHVLLGKLTLAAGVLVPIDALAVMHSHDIGLFDGASLGFFAALAGGLFAVFASWANNNSAPLETSIGQQARAVHAANQSAVGQPSAGASPAQASPGRPQAMRGLPTSLGTLKFVVRTVDVDDGGVTTGGRRIEWRDVAKLRARRMPPDPPFDKALIVDIVPRSGEPIRLLTSSLIDTTRASFPKQMIAKDTFRRILAAARTGCPGVDVDDGTAAFIAGDEAPVLGAVRQLVEQEQTYSSSS